MDVNMYVCLIVSCLVCEAYAFTTAAAPTPIRTVTETPPSPVTTAAAPSTTTQPSIPVGGVTYIRWGRSVCDGQATLVYEGMMGAPGILGNGSGANHLCLHADPQWANYIDGDDYDTTGRGIIFGVEYRGSPDEILDKTNLAGTTFIDQNVPCAVCDAEGRSRELMIPGRTTCPADWIQEYWGYIMAEKYEGSGRSSYICMDHAPEARDGGAQPALFTGHIYNVETRCGSLTCPPYIDGRELACVVCTK